MGVLEQGHSEDPITNARVGEYRRARVLFRKTPSGWEAFPQLPQSEERLRASLKQFPDEVSWTIAFDGRQLGVVKSVNPRDIKSYADSGVQYVADGSKLPRIGEASQRFSGWNEEPTYRPLVLVSQPNFADPDQWKPVSGIAPGPTAVAAFRKSLAGERYYDFEFSEGPGHKPPVFADRDVVVVRAYGAQTGQRLLALALGRKVAPWAYDPDLQPWAIRWFAVTDRTTVLPLEGSLELVDAGDYDADGHSELLFFKPGHNLDEYILWWNGFARHSSFAWSYH